MPDGFDMTIHLNTERGEVVVEQRKAGGVTTHKHITPQTLCDCFLTSRYDDERHATGLLPEDCIAVVMEKKYVFYFMRYHHRCRYAHPHRPRADDSGRGRCQTELFGPL